MSRRSNKASGRETWKVILIAVGITILVWIVFGQTRRFPFINVDDNEYVFKNPMVTRGVSPEGIGWAFTHVHSANWHPLTWLSHALDCEFYGLNAGGHHFTNVVLHAATAVLLFLFLRDLTGALWRSGFAAAFFAIHPLRVESVAWIAERKDVLSGLFFVLTLWAYIRYTRVPSPARYASIALLFALGLMSKPMLVTLPFVLLLLDYWPLKRLLGLSKLVAEKLPLFGLALACGLVTLLAQKQAVQSVAGISIMTRIGNGIISCGIYLRELVWPSCLAAIHPLVPAGVSGGRVVISFLVLGLISALVFIFRRHRYLVTGWLWYLVMLGPVIGIVQVGIQAHADRYTYLPHIGLCVLVVWLAADLVTRWRQGRVVLAITGIFCLGALTVSARAVTSRWQNSQSLWRHALFCTGPNAPAEQNLGEAIYEQGRLEEAIDHYQNALRIDPSLAYARAALGVALLETGRPEESLVQLEQAVRADPNLADAHYNLGNTLLQMGLAGEAVSHYSRAVEINPLDIEACNNLAWVLATCPDSVVRNGPRAVVLAERADSLTTSKSAIVAATLAAAYAEAGRAADAVRTAERAFQLAIDEGNQGRAESIRSQLQSYKAGLAYRDPRYQPRTR
jgi:hypothetical protein